MSDSFVEQRREEVIDILTDAFSRDIIGTEQYELRVEEANRRNSVEELNQLVSDVQGLGGGSAALQRYPDPGMQTVRSIFSSQQMDGDWLVHDHVQVHSVFGSATLDLRRPVLGPLTTITLTAVLGDVKIIVPRGVKVTVDVTPVLGEVKRQNEDQKLLQQVKGFISSFLGEGNEIEPVNPHSHPAARVQVSGQAILGSVYIITKR